MCRRSRHKVEGNDQLTQVLILGSGLVASPVVEYLARDKSVAVTVGKYSIIIYSVTCLILFRYVKPRSRR